MPEPIPTPRDLFHVRLRRMLDVELRLAGEVLPELLEAAHAPDLRYAFERHLLETREHVRVVRSLLADLGASPQPEESPALPGLVAEHEQLVSRAEGPTVADLAHAQAAAATEHLELAAYDALASMADALGEEAAGTTLRELMEQEKHALELVERAMTKLLAEKVESER